MKKHSQSINSLMKFKYFIAISLCLASSLVLAQDIALDEESFAKAAAERVQLELPSYDFKPTIRLTLEGTRPDGESTGQLSLDRIYAFCLRNSQNCNSALDQYAKGIGESIKQRDQPIDQSMVRIAIRPTVYVEATKKRVGPGIAALYDRPVAPGLSAIPVLDYTRAVRFVGEKDLPKLQVTVDEVYSLGEKNLLATSKPLSEITPIPGPKSFGSITGEDYASSRILFHDEWKSLSDNLNGNLIVMIPTPDVLLYGDGSTAIGVDALRAFGLDVAKKSTRPLSSAILHWIPSGWEEVK